MGKTEHVCMRVRACMCVRHARVCTCARAREREKERTREKRIIPMGIPSGSKTYGGTKRATIGVEK